MDGTETEKKRRKVRVYGDGGLRQKHSQRAACIPPHRVKELQLLSEVMQRAGFALSIHDTVLAVPVELASPWAVLAEVVGREGAVASSSLLIWNDGKRAPS